MSASGDDQQLGASRVSDDEALRRMYRITSDHELPFEKKVTELLALGRAYLAVDTGFLTEIADDTQRIVEASGDHELLQPGETCPLSKSYCRKTIDRENAVVVQHAEVEGWESDAAYETFGLESYVGATVVVGDEVHGTFCFADSEPCGQPFTDSEEVFVELLAEWVGYELFQQRATDQIQQQRDQLERFSKVVSHDLRNPLNVVQGYLDLAEETGDPEYFDRCRNALDRMEALIEDLLVLARDGDTIAETESFDVSELVTDCWSFTATEGATLDVDTDMLVSGDRSRLQQLFENLLRNATEHGGPDVTVRVGELDGGSGLYVEDDGPGIAAEDRERIFEEGYSTGESGTGFGLTIVKQIADAHGWEVHVTESADGGARFELSGVDVAEV